MEQLITVLIILPLAILAKNLLGAGHGIQEHKFEWNILKQGLFKGLLIYAGIGVLTLIAVIATEIDVVAQMEIILALTVLLGGVVVVYVKDSVEILGKIWNVPKEEND